MSTDLLLQISMSVSSAWTTVIKMPVVLTLLEALIVFVTLDLREMDSTAQVIQ